jgi:FAD dependent oxidoreductase
MTVVAPSLHAEQLSLGTLALEAFHPESWKSILGRRVLVRDTALPNTDEEAFGDILWHGVAISVDWTDIQTSKTATLYVQFVSGDVEDYTANTAPTTNIWLLPPLTNEIAGSAADPNCHGQFDVCVIGGGAAGLAAAQKLLQQPGTTVAIIEARKDDSFGGRAGLSVGTVSPFGLHATKPPQGSEASEYAPERDDEGFAISPTLPVDWNFVYWARELYQWVILSALLCPVAEPVDVLGECEAEWLRRLEAGLLKDTELAANFRLPKEKAQVCGIWEALRPTSHVSYTLQSFVTPFVLQALVESSTGDDALAVAAAVSGLEPGSFAHLVISAIKGQEIEKMLKPSRKEAVLTDTRQEDEKVEDAAMEDQLKGMLHKWQSLKPKQVAKKHSFINDGVTGWSGHVSAIGKALLPKEKSGELQIVYDAPVTQVEHGRGFLKIWFNRKTDNEHCYFICRAAVVAVPISAVIASEPNSIDFSDSQINQYRSKLPTMIGYTHEERVLGFQFSENKAPWNEVPFPAAWRSPQCRGWAELNSLHLLSSQLKFEIFGDAGVVLVRVPTSVTPHMAKREARSALLSMFPMARGIVPEPTVLDLDFPQGRLTKLAVYDAKAIHELQREFLDGMLVFAGEYLSDTDFGTVAGALTSGESQAARLEGVLKTKLAPEVIDRKPVPMDIGSSTLMGRNVQARELSKNRSSDMVEERKARVTQPAVYDVEFHNNKDLMRCVTVNPDGFKYRKDVRELSVSFPKRKLLSVALKDKQVTEAVIGLNDHASIRTKSLSSRFS